MLTWIKWMAAPVAALALLVMATPSHATPVSFYTVGTFSIGGVSTGSTTVGGVTYTFNNNAVSPSSPLYLQSSSVTVDGPNGGSTVITFSNNSSFLQSLSITPPFLTNVTTGPANAPFGVFNVTSGDATDLIGLSFDLGIVQLAPPAVPNTGVVLGGFTGSIGASTFDPSSAVVTFSPHTIYIPDPATGVRYSVEAPDGTVEISRLLPSPVMGTVAVPLPGIAVAGLWMLGGVGSVGGLKALRRRRTLVAA